MNKITYSITIILLLIILFSCNTCPTNNNDKPKDTIYQVPGCGNHTLAKSTALPEDSSFVYKFNSKLIIEFCVIANCCPDTDRFDYSYDISKDTIFVTVEDTADNLCRCICPYTIHMEIDNPQENHYYFYCQYYDKIIYSEEIYKIGKITMFSDLHVITIYRDAAAIKDVNIVSDNINLKLRYGGGCKIHNFKLFGSDAFMESYPVQADIYISHNANNDLCKALITQEITFDLSPLKATYKQYYNDNGPILLRIHEPEQNNVYDPLVVYEFN